MLQGRSSLKECAVYYIIMALIISILQPSSCFDESIRSKVKLIGVYFVKKNVLRVYWILICMAYYSSIARNCRGVASSYRSFPRW